MSQKMYQVDAFTDRLFTGNPAAVCPLTEWLPDELMQQMAMEHNQAETAFYVPAGDGFELRWFTPAVEVDLCGHATLAAAQVLFAHEGYTGMEIRFQSPRSGPLTVRREGDRLTLNFPADTLESIAVTPELTAPFAETPIAAFRGKTDYLLVFDSEETVRKLAPDFARLIELDCRGVIVTARGAEVDFVSRFFGPQVGIPEDPVTGSAHTLLTPYWAQELGKTSLTALQVSPRGGRLWCTLVGDRVEISGTARTYMAAEIYL